MIVKMIKNRASSIYCNVIEKILLTHIYRLVRTKREDDETSKFKNDENDQKHVCVHKDDEINENNSESSKNNEENEDCVDTQTNEDESDDKYENDEMNENEYDKDDEYQYS